MLLCLLLSGPVCIIFWSEWCHCESVVMVISAFIVSSHSSEGCRRITHPPDCCSGPLNPPAVSPKLHHKLRFSLSSESSWMTEDLTQRERAAGTYHFPSARTPLWLMFLHLYLPQQALLPASFCKAWWEQDPSSVTTVRKAAWSKAGEESRVETGEGGMAGIGWWLP